MTSNDEQSLEVAERFMDALERCDIDAVRELYAPDARLWHNFDRSAQPVEENLKTLAWIHRKLDDLKYEVVRRELVPGGFCQQHVLKGTLASGDEFSMPACVIARVENGKIVAIDEYLDSAHTKPLRGL